MPNNRRIILVAGLLVGLGFVAALGYRFWYQPTFDFVDTDDALVAGSLVRVAVPASGQINDLYIDVGDEVKKGDALATIKVVSSAPSVAAAPSVPRVLARVMSPITGAVATRNVSVGDTVAAGQALATLVDLNQLWVVVNVSETRAAELRTGQSADVAIASVNRTFRGKVAEIGSATTEVTAAPGPLGLTASSDTTKKIPVKVTFDYSGYRLVPGMSANVLIYTRAAPQ